MSAPHRHDTLQLVGEPRLLHADGTSGALEPKDALLLAYLALEGPTPRRVLAARLWPDVDVERARANLRQRLFRLRRALGRDLLEVGEVAVLCADLEIDLRTGDAAAGGGLLQGLDEADAGGLGDWLAEARERRRSAHLLALVERASQLESSGRLAPALAAAQQLVDADQTSEHGHRRLMRLHYLRGDRAAALAAFDRCCDALQRLLGVAPDAETEALRARVESGTREPGPRPMRPLPVSVLRPPRLIGREAEWQALEAAWAANTAILVSGEAGLGKTRLVGDFARTRPRTVIVAARPGDARVPHALLSRLLRQLLAEIGRAPAAGVGDELAHLLPELGRIAPRSRSASPMRFINATETLLRQAVGEGLAGLVLDDLQFADTASVEIVQQLAEAGTGVRWIVAFRPGELTPAAQRFHDELLGAHGARLCLLQPLATPQIVDLIDSLGVAELEAARLAPALARHSGGNPLFLLETMKLLLTPQGQPGPAEPAGARLPTATSVNRLIARRLDRLSPAAVRLARCAAIAGLDFSPQLAAHVLGVRALDLIDAWAELDAAQILRDGAFAHDLVLEAARESVPAPIARGLHLEMAKFLEDRGAEPARVAQHWLDGGDAPKALPSLVAAAERAAAAWRAQEAGALLLQAARISQGPGADRAGAFALLLRAHRAYLQSDLDSSGHREVLDALDGAAESPPEKGHAHFARADTLSQSGSGPPAEAEARAGLAAIAAESGGSVDALRMDLVSALANALFLQDRPLEGAEAVRAAAPDLLRLDDRPRQIEHCTNLGVLLDAANQHAEAQATTRQGIALARAEGDRIGELVLLNNLAFSLHDVGRAAAALEPLGEALRLKQTYPELRTSALFVQVQLGNMHRSLGGYAEALEFLQKGLSVVGGYSPVFAAGAHNSLAQLYLDLGQRARSQQHLRQSLAIEATPPVIRAISHLLRARAALDQAEARLAGEALRDADGFIIASTRYAIRGQATLLGARLLEPEAAYRSATTVAREAARLQMEGLRMTALAWAARHALACGREAEAVAHALEALALWPEHAPDPGSIAEVWLAAVDCLDAAGDARAEGVLRTAVDWIAAAHRDRVPEPFRESFLHRNGVHRALMARAARGGGTTHI